MKIQVVIQPALLLVELNGIEASRSPASGTVAHRLAGGKPPEPPRRSPVRSISREADEDPSRDSTGVLIGGAERDRSVPLARERDTVAHRLAGGEPPEPPR